MTRISPAAQHELMLFHTLNTQARMHDRQLQLGSGKVSQNYAGIAEQSARLLSLEASATRTTQYIDNIGFFDNRLALIDISFSTIDTAARDIRAILDRVVSFPDSHATDLRQTAAAARDLVRDMLNVRDGTRYLLGGTRIDQPPVSLDPATYASIGVIEADGVTVDETAYQAYYTEVLGNTLPYAQGSFYDQIFFEKNGVAPAGPLPADLDNPTLQEFVGEDPDLWQFYLDRLNSSAMLSSPKLDYYNGDTQNQTMRADDNLQITLEVRADATAFQQILTALDAVANLSDDVPDTDFERAVVAKARDMLNQALGSDTSAGYDSLQALRADLAGARVRINDTRDRHESLLAYTEGAVGDIENVDPAEVVVRLQHDELALQAAFAAISELRSMSLLNFL